MQSQTNAATVALAADEKLAPAITPAVSVGAAQDVKSTAFYFPPEVESSDLFETRKLLSESEIARLEKLLADKPYGRYSKDFCGVPYGILKTKQGLCAIYNKKGQQVVLRTERLGEVKLIQNLVTGQWRTLKTTEGHGTGVAQRYIYSLYSEKIHVEALGKTPDPTIFSRPQRKGEKQIKRSLIADFDRGETLESLITNIYKKYPKCPDLFFLHVVLAVIDCYEQSVFNKRYLHNNINSRFILFDLVDFNAHMTDFIYSAQYPQGNPSVRLSTAYGAARYTALECTSGDATEKTEVYAFGVLFKEILFRQFSDFSWSSITFTPIDSTTPKFGAMQCEPLTTPASFLAGMRAGSPNHRPTLQAVKEYFLKLKAYYEATYPEEVAALAEMRNHFKELETRRLQGPHQFKQVEVDAKVSGSLVPAVSSTAVEKNSELLEFLSRKGFVALGSLGSDGLRILIEMIKYMRGEDYVLSEKDKAEIVDSESYIGIPLRSYRDVFPSAFFPAVAPAPKPGAPAAEAAVILAPSAPSAAAESAAVASPTKEPSSSTDAEAHHSLMRMRKGSLV